MGKNISFGWTVSFNSRPPLRSLLLRRADSTPPGFWFATTWKQMMSECSTRFHLSPSLPFSSRIWPTGLHPFCFAITKLVQYPGGISWLRPLGIRRKWLLISLKAPEHWEGPLLPSPPTDTLLSPVETQSPRLCQVITSLSSPAPSPLLPASASPRPQYFQIPVCRHLPVYCTSFQLEGVFSSACLHFLRRTSSRRTCAHGGPSAVKNTRRAQHKMY